MGLDMNLPLVVSMGEPAGIGPDIILKAYSERQARGLPFFYVVGDVDCLNARAALLNLDVVIKPVATGSDARELFDDFLPILQGIELGAVTPGQISSANGRFVIEAIRQSVADIHSGVASALVTAPIHKAALYEAGFNFPGHTEYLASLSSESYDVDVRPVMMLASDELRVVPVTIHVPLSDVPSLLTKELIVETVTIVDRDLRSRFNIEKPHIILTGLNPHAGEDGTLGRTEIEVIEPAIAELCELGMNVTGPFSADICFHPRARAGYDAAVAMYHDQALIPIKTLSFDEGVNVTLGLPFVRTSPDHGTALDIAGSGKARVDSFVAALKMASTMVCR